MTLRPRVVINATDIVLELEDGERLTTPITDGGVTPALSRALNSIEVGWKGTVDLVLSPPHVQLRTLTDLPPVRRRDLLDLIKNQRDRFFRPTNGPVLVSAQWAQRSEGAGRVARAALASRELLETIESLVGEESGCRIDEFVPVRGEEEFPPLATPRADLRHRTQRRRDLLGAIALACLGWIAAGATYVGDLYLDGRKVSGALEQLEAPLNRLDSVSAQLASFEPVAMAFERQSPEAGWLVDRLASVIMAIPTEAHVHGLSTTRDGTTTVEVHGPDAIDVVERLKQGWEGQVRLDGTPELTTTADGRSLERFTVVLESGAG